MIQADTKRCKALIMLIPFLKARTQQIKITIKIRRRKNHPCARSFLFSSSSRCCSSWRASTILGGTIS